VAGAKGSPTRVPDCNGCVNLEGVLCEDCGLTMLLCPTLPEVDELLDPERARIEDVDAFIDDVLGA
jgi:hypothetical protein